MGRLIPAGTGMEYYRHLKIAGEDVGEEEMMTDTDLAISEGVPEIALKKFSKWHYPTLEMLYDYINVLGSSAVYPTNQARTNTFLLIMNLLQVTTVGDAERSLKELNGEVGGKLYKNLTLEH